jgi:hypothetical protein
MPTAADHGHADERNDDRPGRIPPATERGPDETKPLEPKSRPLGPSGAAMTARLRRIRDKLRQRQRP